MSLVGRDCRGALTEHADVVGVVQQRARNRAGGAQEQRAVGPAGVEHADDLTPIGPLQVGIPGDPDDRRE